MELLKIDENHRAFFSRNGEWASVQDIERDDLLALIDKVAENNDIHLDECTAENDIVDQIEKTIYQQLYTILHDLDDKREAYLSDIDSEFDELERQYKLGSLKGD